MTERKWLPSDYVDERSPPARPSPTDWIIKLPDGTHALDQTDDLDDDPVDRILAEGELVSFAWTALLGVIDIKFDAEGNWTRSAEIPREYPEAHISYWFPGDPESVTDNLDEMLRQEFLNDPESYPAESVTIAVQAWNNRDQKFLFTGGKFIEAPDA